MRVLQQVRWFCSIPRVRRCADAPEPLPSTLQLVLERVLSENHTRTRRMLQIAGYPGDYADTSLINP